MDSPVLDVTADEAADLSVTPIPSSSAGGGETGGVFRGSVMDWTKAPDDCGPNTSTPRCPSTR